MEIAIKTYYNIFRLKQLSNAYVHIASRARKYYICTRQIKTFIY